MHRRHRQAVARDTDEPDEPLVSRLDSRLESPVFAQRELPLDHIDEVVEVDQVDVVNTQPVERAPYLLPRSLYFLSPVFVATKNCPGWRSSQGATRSSEPVRRGGIDVVHAMLEQQRESGVRFLLRDPLLALLRRRSPWSSRVLWSRTACGRSPDER